ncbi:uncharacterized protein LOC119551995 isoform X2 [Drosophila subpulchrella]|nr:uncharacterized protein LOC119551995 isoform X2 [Drosophila subpulchrella]
MMELGPVTEPHPHDHPNEATAFLERHFGRNPQVRASMATQQGLSSMHLNGRNSEVNFQDRDAVIWHTWLVEKVRFPPAQCAIIEEWKDPFTETLGSCYCVWHLQNCMAWQLVMAWQPSASVPASRKLWTLSTNSLIRKWIRINLLPP